MCTHCCGCNRSVRVLIAVGVLIKALVVGVVVVMGVVVAVGVGSCTCSDECTRGGGHTESPKFWVTVRFKVRFRFSQSQACGFYGSSLTVRGGRAHSTGRAIEHLIFFRC